MSVWTKLYEVYPKIEMDKGNKDARDIDKFLLQDGLSINNAGLEITLDSVGNVVNIFLVPKAKSKTLFPVTPDSVKRSGSTIAPNPLFEKLDYMAKDWNLIVKDEKVLEKGKNAEKYLKYIEILGKWANFTKFPQIKIIYNFLKNANIIELILSSFDLKDLVSVSSKDSEESEQNDIETQDDEQESEIAIEQIEQENISNTSGQISAERLQNNLKIADKYFKKLADIFVRFQVILDDAQPEIYQNLDILNEWIEFYPEILGLRSEDCLDYLTGKQEPMQTFYPKKIRHQGDGARIISSNDATIRTFGGRFDPNVPKQAASIGQESMTKALYSLSWLIKNNHAYSYDGLVILAWSTKFIREENPLNFFGDVEYENGKYQFNISSNKALEALAYYGNRSKTLDDLATEHKVNVLILDGETKGRISICYYNEIDNTTYYKNLTNWFETLQWLWWNSDTKEYDLRTPNFTKLFELIYKESKEDKKLRKQFYKDILPCVVEGKTLPRYFVQRAFEKVRKPESFKDSQGGYSATIWRDAINIACAIFNKYYDLRGKYMKLDTNETDRSYLFGRLLALTEKVENVATNYAGQTNAERLFTRFTMRPGQTFFTLQKQLAPYFDKLYGQGKAGLANYFKNEIAEVLDKMSKEDLASNKAVDEMFILGYYGQRNNKTDKEKENESQNETQGDE